MTTPSIRCQMTVEEFSADGNGFVIIGKVRMALRRAGADAAYLEAFTTEALSGDYDHLLLTAMRYTEFVEPCCSTPSLGGRNHAATFHGGDKP
jgi:hypothetical protein